MRFIPMQSNGKKIYEQLRNETIMFFPVGDDMTVKVFQNFKKTIYSVQLDKHTLEKLQIQNPYL